MPPGFGPLAFEATAAIIKEALAIPHQFQNPTYAPDMLPHYDFSKGVRGRYAKQYAEAFGVNPIIRHLGAQRWEGLPVLNYKEEGSHFQAISRQVLFAGGPQLPAELRYFEIEPGGHSTLERHDHIHSVMVLRGCGKCLVGTEVYELALHDLVSVPSQTWHQFRATGAEALGFLCLVNAERDRPERPDAASLAALMALPGVAEFVRA